MITDKIFSFYLCLFFSDDFFIATTIANTIDKKVSCTVSPLSNTLLTGLRVRTDLTAGVAMHWVMWAPVSRWVFGRMTRGSQSSAASLVVSGAFLLSDWVTGMTTCCFVCIYCMARICRLCKLNSDWPDSNLQLTDLVWAREITAHCIRYTWALEEGEVKRSENRVRDSREPLP